MVVVLATIGVSVTGSYMSTSRMRRNCPILMISMLMYNETGIKVLNMRMKPTRISLNETWPL